MPYRISLGLILGTAFSPTLTVLSACTTAAFIFERGGWKGSSCSGNRIDSSLCHGPSPYINDSAAHLLGRTGSGVLLSSPFLSSSPIADPASIQVNALSTLNAQMDESQP